MDTNVVVLTGKLTTPVEFKLLDIDSERSVGHFSIVFEHQIKDKFKNRETVLSHIDCEVWDRIAENCRTYLNKGSKISITGYLKQDKWANKEGKVFNKLKLVAHQVIFMDRD